MTIQTERTKQLVGLMTSSESDKCNATAWVETSTFTQLTTVMRNYQYTSTSLQTLLHLDSNWQMDQYNLLYFNDCLCTLGCLSVLEVWAVGARIWRLMVSHSWSCILLCFFVEISAFVVNKHLHLNYYAMFRSQWANFSKGKADG